MGYKFVSWIKTISKEILTLVLVAFRIYNRTCTRYIIISMAKLMSLEKTWRMNTKEYVQKQYCYKEPEILLDNYFVKSAKDARVFANSDRSSLERKISYYNTKISYREIIVAKWSLSSTLTNVTAMNIPRAITLGSWSLGRPRGTAHGGISCHILSGKIGYYKAYVSLRLYLKSSKIITIEK